MDGQSLAPEVNRSAFRHLFCAGVETAELSGAGSRLAVSEREAECVADAAPKRRADFHRGRHCARKALACLGVVDFDLLVGPGREPIWPIGFVGSITHTPDFCFAAVASSSDVFAVGVDAEMMGAVSRDLWPQIFTLREIAYLRHVGHLLNDIASSIMFSAKETYFKAQYPHTGAVLDFHDAEVVLGDGLFMVRRFCGGPKSLERLEGRFVVSGDMALTAISLRR